MAGKTQNTSQDSWVIVNRKYRFRKLVYGWVLHQCEEGGEKTIKVSYHQKLSGVVEAILDIEVGGCDSVQAILDRLDSVEKKLEVQIRSRLSGGR